MERRQRESAGPLSRLFSTYREGVIDRRTFARRAAALGVALPGVLALAEHGALAQESSPEASPVGATPVDVVAAGSVGIPDDGTEGQTRGAGGDLRILVPQAASALSIHNATGGKDISAASVISEPLLNFAADSSLVPCLATAVPTIANGQLAEDLSTVTFTLKPDVLWSDGQPLTSADIVFTWQWNIDPANGSIDAVSWEIISSIEAIDDLTAQVTFAAPTLGWSQAFASNLGAIYPAHFWDGKDAAAANDEFATSPIGTGPYIVSEFAPNDQIVYSLNPNYREANKPFFERVILKGGGDPATAVRAVTQTGDWDLAFTLQIDPDALAGALGDLGQIYGAPGTGVEKIQFNFSDPNTDVDGQRSQKDTPHPFLADPAVRQAIALGIDRQVIAERLFNGVTVSSNLLAGLESFESPNTTWAFDPEQARQILDAAGWVLNGSVREKDGVRLSLLYVTTATLQRQKVQAVVKGNLEAIGFEVEIRSVDGSIFFDGAPGNEQNFTHFYSDMQEYTDGATSIFPLNYMKYWYAGPDGENIAQAENDWTGTNKVRYSNAEYDEAYDQVVSLTDPDELAERFIALNDIVIADNVEVPLVLVAADLFAASDAIRVENIGVNAFGNVFWNLANWNRR